MFFSHLNRSKGRATPWGGGISVGEEPQNGDTGGLFGEFCLTVGEDDQTVRGFVPIFQEIKNAEEICPTAAYGSDGG